MPAALRGVVSQVDASLFHWVIAHRSPLLNQPMMTLGHGGALVWACGAVILGLLVRRRWPAVFQALIAIGLAALVADFAAKPIVARHRPFVSFTGVEVMAKQQRSGSFPSTHAAASFAGAFALSRVFPEIRVAFWVLAALIAFARVYVGVHYPLDVAGGALIGLAAAAFAIGGTKWKGAARRAGAPAYAPTPRDQSP